MKKTKQILSVLLTVAMLLFSLSVCLVSFAADDSGGCGSGLTWTYNDASKTLTISGNGVMNDYSKVSYKKNTTAPWFDYASDTTKIIIGNGVQKIGDYAFAYFSQITKLELPNSVETLGLFAFYCCSSLVNVSFGSGLKSISARAFSDCTSLATFNFPDQVESIANYAFFKCPVKDLVLGRNVSTIGKLAFSQCKLVNVTMYNKVSVIGESAFAKQNNKANDVISHIYYYGSQADWNAINIGNDNAPLTGAALHIMGAPSEPATEPATQPTQPTQPATQPTTAPSQDEAPAKRGFFERILQMILDFFARLFGR